MHLPCHCSYHRQTGFHAPVILVGVLIPLLTHLAEQRIYFCCHLAPSRNTPWRITCFQGMFSSKDQTDLTTWAVVWRKCVVYIYIYVRCSHIPSPHLCTCRLYQTAMYVLCRSPPLQSVMPQPPSLMWRCAHCISCLLLPQVPLKCPLPRSNTKGRILIR